jgi:DNA-directed RNA polymerase specialized sigma24 family protein
MPAERISMRQVRDVLRLRYGAGISGREIGRRLSISASTVRETLKLPRPRGSAGRCHRT